MLLNDFFTIRKIETSAGEVKAELVINAGHKIFEGHFPNQPVVPGVCQMQMVKEIIEQVTGRKTNLINAGDMKFLAVINPGQNNIISATLKYVVETNQTMSVAATLSKAELTHFKFKGEFVFV